MRRNFPAANGGQHRAPARPCGARSGTGRSDGGPAPAPADRGGQAARLRGEGSHAGSCPELRASALADADPGAQSRVPAGLRDARTARRQGSKPRPPSPRGKRGAGAPREALPGTDRRSVLHRPRRRGERARRQRQDRAALRPFGRRDGANFFHPAFALEPGEVYQSAPYVSPDTNEWVIANAAPIPRVDGVKAAIVHFELTLESIRRAIGASGDYAIRIADRRTGRILVDTRYRQRPNAPLASKQAPHTHPSGVVDPKEPHVHLPAGLPLGHVTESGHRLAFRDIPVTANNANPLGRRRALDSPTCELGEQPEPLAARHPLRCPRALPAGAPQLVARSARAHGSGGDRPVDGSRQFGGA
jgi:hypothetical protein